MSLYRLLLRSTTKPVSLLRTLSLSLPQLHRSFAFSSAEEAAAERRKRKRRLRIEPPLHAIQYNRPARDPNAPRLPDSTSALVGPRLNIHNRVQSLIRAFDLDAASHVARTSVFGRVRPTVFTCNAIIAAMFRSKRYNDAVALFKYFFQQCDIVPNVVSYNNLINTHCDEGRVDMGLEVYKDIIENAPFSPSAVTYRHLTKGLIDAGRIDDAVDLLREMLNKGQGADSLVYNNVIKGFLDLGNLVRANEFFDELKERCLVYDGVVSATFMDWWFQQGKDKEAMESYKSLMDKNFRMVPTTCNVLLEVLLKYGKEDVAWALFEQMLDNHTPPTFQAVNSDTFNIMVNYLMKEGKIVEAVETFKKAGTKPGSKPFAMDVAGYNNIISMFCEKEMLGEAEQFFAELQAKHLSPDVTSFRALIDAYLKMDRIDDALRLFDQMVSTGLWVVASFGTRVFTEFINNGKVVESADVLLKMANAEKEPKPDASLYDIVVRGLCKVSEFEKSKEILDQMMTYDIGVPPALKEFVIEAFGKVGKSEEIKKILDESRWASTSTYTQTPQVNRRYSQIGSDHTLSPFQNVGSGQSQMASGESLRQHEMGKHAPNGTPQTTWTQLSGFQGISGQYQTGQQQSGNYQAGDQQKLWNSQMGGQRPSWSSQMGDQKSQFQDLSGQQSGNYQTGGHQSWNSQMEEQRSGNYQTEGKQGQRPSWNSQMGDQKPQFQDLSGQQQSGHHHPVGQQSGNYQTGGHQSWNSQMEGQQSGNYQTEGKQQSWNDQEGGKQSGNNYQTGGQQKSWNNQMAGQQQGDYQTRGQQQLWNHQMGGQQLGNYQTRGQQQSWDNQKGGQQPSWNTQMGGQQPSWNSQMGGQQPSWNTQMGGPQPSWSTQMGGQLPSNSSQSGAQQQQSSWSSQGRQSVGPRQAGQQQTYGDNHSAGNVPFEPFQSTGQGSFSVAENNRTTIPGIDKGQGSQLQKNGGEQLSNMGVQQQISGQLPFRSFQNAGQQTSSMVGQRHPDPSRVAGQYQQSWTSQMREQKTYGDNHSAGNVPFEPFRSTGKGSFSVAENNRTTIPGIDKGQGSHLQNNGGEQLSNMGVQQQISGQLSFQSFQNAGQQTSSMVGQHHPDPSRVAGQYQGKNIQQQESRWQQNETEEMSGQNSTGRLEWQHDNKQVAV